MKNELLKKGYSNLGNYFEDPTFNLNQEINKLRMEIKKKDEYINNIMSALLPDTNIEAFNDISGIKSQLDSQSIGQIIMKMKKLEKENKELKNNCEESKISEALARENAKLRMKIKDLEDKLCPS